MGMMMSFMGNGEPSMQMLSFVIGGFYQQFLDRDITDFNNFRIAILDIFNNINSALPGKHYNSPSRKEMEEFFENWKKSEEKKTAFIEFMRNAVKLDELDNAVMLAGLVAPPAAMAVKRTGESVPQLKLVKAIPDVIFVPSATMLAIISIKLSKRFLMGKKVTETPKQGEGEKDGQKET